MWCEQCVNFVSSDQQGAKGIFPRQVLLRTIHRMKRTSSLLPLRQLVYYYLTFYLSTKVFAHTYVGRFIFLVKDRWLFCLFIKIYMYLHMYKLNKKYYYLRNKLYLRTKVYLLFAKK